MQNPLTRLIPFYPGQWGVPGSDNTLGLRNLPRTNVFYVDYSNPAASDDNDGTNPDAPLRTLQEAVDRVTNTYDVIIVRTMGIESVDTPVYGSGPSSVRIIGVGDDKSQNGVYWESPAGEPCLTVRAPGWYIEGFRFGPGTGSIGIQIQMTGAPGVDANAIGIFTHINNCYFYGANGGAGDATCGVDLYGGAYEVTIENCKFEFFARAGGAAIQVRDSSFANPYRQYIRNCVFQENITHIDCNIGAGRGFNSSFIEGCYFSGRAASPGASFTNVLTGPAIDLTGGTGNFVTGNYFGGIYRNPAAGDYQGGTNDFWVGNHADPSLEAVPGTTVNASGLTVAPPAA